MVSNLHVLPPVPLAEVLVEFIPQLTLSFLQTLLTPLLSILILVQSLHFIHEVLVKSRIL